MSTRPPRRHRSRWLAAACVWTLALLSAGPASAVSIADLEGAWRPESYVMKDGVTREVGGLIVFSKTQWLTLFFIKNGAELERGASEGGAFTLAGDRLTLRHHVHLSAGKALPNVPETAPLRMELSKPEDASTEPCQVEIAGDQMTIRFPSGNRMLFQRVR